LAPPTPRDAYARRLADAGLDSTSLGLLWVHEAERALAEAPRVDAPFRETGILDASRAQAFAYRFSAEAGQRLTFELSPAPDSVLVFLDLFRAAIEPGAEPEHVASADSGVFRLVHEPRRDGDYIIRAQPELLRGGRYTLTVTAEPVFAFPVEGGAIRDVGSFFGDPRDGGRRDHHGIDIFARRNTPVIAPVRATVRRVSTTPIGGRVVWLRDEARNLSIYYAHLEEQLVERGQVVEVGDTLGRVGNSGNARTTPPHLHFGIYRRGMGPVDPMPWVRPLPTRLPALASIEPGGTRHVSAQDLRLRAAPYADAPELDRLERDSTVRVLAVVGDWLRVELPDGRRGFVASGLTTEAAEAE
jgi:murein DD-endopeptidase MepM/ murein hydrolase activator NlpD